MTALPSTEAFTVYSPEALALVDSARFRHQAATFLDARGEVIGVGGTLPDIAALALDVGPPVGAMTRIEVRTFPSSEAPELMAAAERGVVAIGGAGFDALIARTRRIWQVPSHVDGDARVPLVVAGLLASVLLGPIVPPDEETIYGVKGARLRLQARGWPHSPA
jgi:hypothetical protein